MAAVYCIIHSYHFSIFKTKDNKTKVQETISQTFFIYFPVDILHPLYTYNLKGKMEYSLLQIERR